MNLCIKIVLSIIVSLLLLISMAGFSQAVPPPPYKEGITGRVMSPSPETTKDIASWIPVIDATLTLTDSEGINHKVTTGEDGYYIFTNVAVDAKCVITATAIVNGKTMVFKDIIPQPVAADEFYDAGTADAESTALALIVEKLIEQWITPEDINLEEIQASDSFTTLVEQVSSVLEDKGNVMDHIISATFVMDTYTITASAGSNGSISPSGAVTVNHGSSKSFTITPDDNYHISDIKVDGTSVGGTLDSPYIYNFTNVTDGHTIAATFAINTYTITASAGSNGSISPSGAVTVNHGSSKSFTITPDYNYHIDDVLVDGISEGAVDYYSFNNVTRDHIISATFAINTYTITASAGSNGSISPSGAVTVNHGSSKSFTITPDDNYHIDDVLVDGISEGAVDYYSFNNVTRDHIISATFAINTYTITASAGSNGSISPSGAVTVDHDSSKTFTITPDPNYHIDDVLVDGSSEGAVASYIFSNVTRDHIISATFAINTYTITASAGSNGSISPSGAVTVDHDSSKTFTITPDPNYHIDDVLVDGSSEGAVASYIFSNVTAGHTIAATFTINTYTITASAGENGSIDPSGVVTVDHGANQSFTITPDDNYHISDIKVDGTSVGGTLDSPYIYNFTNVTDGHTIAATFAINTYTITASAGSNGSISPSGAVTVNHGSSKSFTITPDDNYHISDIKVDGTSVGGTLDSPYIYNFTNVTDGHTIAATFAINTYTITASAGSNGSISPSGAVTVNHGSSKSFTITPDYNYHIDDVLVDGISEGAVDYYSFNNVTRDHIISATFDVVACVPDHFTFDIIDFSVTGEKVKGLPAKTKPFGITITARDVDGNTATNYNGTGTLTLIDGSGDTITHETKVVIVISSGTDTGGTTVTFIDGVWADDVTIGESSAMLLGLAKGDPNAFVSIKITTDNGTTGVSNYFIVTD